MKCCDNPALKFFREMFLLKKEPLRGNRNRIYAPDKKESLSLDFSESFKESQKNPSLAFLVSF